MKRLIAILWLCPLASFATKPPVSNDPQPESVASSYSNSSAQAGSDVSVVSGGGQGGGASNQLSMGGDRSTTVAIGNTAPIPLHAVPDCYLPAKGIKRIRRVLFGAVDFDPRLVRDPDCYADVVARRAYELAKIEAEAKLELARAERIKAERGLSSAVSK